ncbi:MAG: hypothetical protein F6J93_38355 [Oscillatoria sp. SIO1A7]|nr:hypothetical protein [Oscillatoria sp. SIO1A7]
MKQGRNDWYSWVSLRSTLPYIFKADNPVGLSSPRKRSGNSMKFPYTPHPTPYTLHPKPHTLHPKPHTPHPKPHPPHPKPQTPHPKPHTPQPTPQTPHPKRKSNCLTPDGK